MENNFVIPYSVRPSSGIRLKHNNKRPQGSTQQGWHVRSRHAE